MYQILSKLVDECWGYSKPNQYHFWAWLKTPILGVLDSQGSAETLVRIGGIIHYRLIAYSLGNISAKNYHNRLMCIEVIVCKVSVVFWDTVYVSSLSSVAISCQKLLKLVDECGRYNKQNQCYFRYTAWLNRPNFWVHVSPRSGKTLTRGGGIMCVEVIVCYISVVFETQCTITETKESYYY